MAFQKIINVPLGAIIRLEGGLYRLVSITSGQPYVQKKVTDSIWMKPVAISEVARSYNSIDNYIVDVVSTPTPKTDLKDSFLSQLQGVSSVTSASVTKSDLTTQLRAQSALQKATDAASQADAVAEEVGELEEEVEELEETVEAHGSVLETHGHQIHSLRSRTSRVEGYLAGHQDHSRRISYLEQKQKEEEHALNVQRALDEKLAKQKQQSYVQAQFNEKLKTTGGNGKMKNLLGGFKSQFGKVEGKFAFAATGGLALRKGISQDFVAFDKKTNSITDVSGLTLDFKIPAFKLPTAVDQVKKGDLVLNGADYGYVTRVYDDFLEVIIPEKNVNGSVRPTKNALLNASFYTVVQTLDAAGQGGFNPMLLMAMGDGNKDELVKIMALTGGFGGAQGGNGQIDPMMFALLGDNMDDILPLLLLQQGGAVQGNGIQSILPFLLMGDKGGKSNDMLPFLLMNQGQQAGGAQAGGINPMMMMALSGDGDIDPMMLMMMGGGFGGAGFGGAQQAPAQQAPAQEADSSTDGE